MITGERSAVHETLRALKSLGVWLSIDDFGTGHSSLGRLRDYEFDELKIDRSFVGDLDSGDPTLVATQIAMAHGLGLGVVAEGVETQAQLEYLRKAGAARCRDTSSLAHSQRSTSERCWRALGNGAGRSPEGPI